MKTNAKTTKKAKKVTQEALVKALALRIAELEAERARCPRSEFLDGQFTALLDLAEYLELQEQVRAQVRKV